MTTARTKPQNRDQSATLDSFEQLLTYVETAEVLGVTDRTVRTLVRTGALPAVRFGGSVRIDPADLREFVENAKRERKGGVK